jgi:hypothetical protein
MSISKARFEFAEASLAAFNSEVDTAIDMVWSQIGTSQDNVYVSVNMHVAASDDATTRVHNFNFSCSDTTSTLVKSMLDAWNTGITNTVAASAFDAISSVYGTAVVVVEY